MCIVPKNKEIIHKTYSMWIYGSTRRNPPRKENLWGRMSESGECDDVMFGDATISAHTLKNNKSLFDYSSGSQPGVRFPRAQSREKSEGS